LIFEREEGKMIYMKEIKEKIEDIKGKLLLLGDRL
jgi:hypothetical protein